MSISCSSCGRRKPIIAANPATQFAIGIRDYSVFEGGQRIGRIRFAGERMPGVWLWSVVTLPGTDFRSSETDLTGGLPMGSSTDLDTAKAEFKAAWEALKAGTSP